MVLHLHVDQRSGYPVYLQLVEQIRRSVALGVLAPGEQLPSVKQLASQLVINPATVSRAMRELEYLGIIETQPGRGAFVRPNGSVAAARASAQSEVRSALDAAVREARALGVDEQTLREIFAAALDRFYRTLEEVR